MVCWKEKTVLWTVNELAETLSIILGKSWRISEVPGGQRRTNVICIFTNEWGGEERKNLLKYRQVDLISIPEKFIEKCL